MSSKNMPKLGRYHVIQINKIISKSTYKFKKSKKHKGPVEQTTHGLIRSILRISQYVGFIPLYNVSDTDPNKLRYIKFSVKVVYTLFLVIYGFVCALLILHKGIRKGDIVLILEAPIACLKICGNLMLSIELAKNWKSYVQKWDKFEKKFLKLYGAPQNLERSLKRINRLIFGLGFAEHLQVLKKIYNLGLVQYIRDFNTDCLLCSYFGNRLIMAIFFWIVGWILSIAWHIGDLFIINISLILSSRFSQLSRTVKEYIETENNKNKMKHPVNFYGQIRKDYNLLNNSVEEVDRIMSSVILFSYFCNGFYILIALFNSVRASDNSLEKIITLNSFFFVILRLTLVTVYAASINEESKKFVFVLSKHQEDWNDVDLQRLIIQVQFDSSSLSGRKFFKITKGLLLQISAAIITYELGLIQFYEIWHPD